MQQGKNTEQSTVAWSSTTATPFGGDHPRGVAHAIDHLQLQRAARHAARRRALRPPDAHHWSLNTDGVLDAIAHNLSSAARCTAHGVELHLALCSPDSRLGVCRRGVLGLALPLLPGVSLLVLGVALVGRRTWIIRGSASMASWCCAAGLRCGRPALAGRGA